MPVITSLNEFENLDFINASIECGKLLKLKFDNKAPTYFIHSYGCQGNVADGEKIKGILNNMDCVRVDAYQDAEIVILNGCAIRESAQNRVIGNLGRVIYEKRKNNNKLILLCGCMFQQKSVSTLVLETYSDVNIIFGTHCIDKLPNLLLSFLTENKRIFYAPELNTLIDEKIIPAREDKVKCLIPISYGCNNFCSYCIVPYVKGRERSRRSTDIIKEAKSLIDMGYKELTLLGQNVNSYGNDIKDEINFSSLLKKINEIDGDFRIRFMTSHPKDASKELIDTISTLNKVCKHIHLPFQSGSDRILKKMNRKYSVSDYLKIIEYAKNKIDNITFTSDIIVGFPGENEEDFQKTLNLVKEVEFLSLFTFIFSKREGTKAASLTDKTPNEVKVDRLKRIIDLQNNISEKIHKTYQDTTNRVLIEGKSRVSSDFLTGRTNNHLIVDIKGDENLIGEFHNVKIDKTLRLALNGHLID